VGQTMSQKGELGLVAGQEGFWTARSGQVGQPVSQKGDLGLVAGSTGGVLEWPSGSNRVPEGRFRTGGGGST